MGIFGRMPLFRRRSAPAAAPEPTDPGAPPPAPHLLLCDDDVTVTKIVGLLFEQDGWTVEVARSGRECLRALDQRVPDVIVVDQRFYYGLNGLETAELVRQGGFDRPIVLFSAHLDDVARERADRLQVLPVSKADPADVVRHVTAAHTAYRARSGRS
jgi:CheY-like chemotaxis protein